LQRLGEEFQVTYADELEARGEVRGEARMLLKVFAARKLPVDDATRAHIVACANAETLER
jgi:hypothetical protein